MITPKSFMIAETKVNRDILTDALRHLGVKEWSTDAQDDHCLLTEVAGKLCYMSFDKDLNKNLTRTGGRNNFDYIQQGIIGNRHGSVLEHSTVTFLIADVSRVVTHELVRHRAGTAFSQVSGRYVRTENIQLYIPDDIKENPAAVGIFEKAAKEMEANIRLLSTLTDIDSQGFGVKKRLTSAFRRLIGCGQSNHILVTANHRAWRHIVSMRTSEGAEEEIHLVLMDIYKQLLASFPTIYADATVVDDEVRFKYESV